MQFTFANNINTTLAAPVSSGATTITLSSSAHLPASIPTGLPLVITLNDAATLQNFEILYATAVSGATLTVSRGQEGTTALTWNTGDFAFSGPTAGQMVNIGRLINIQTWSTVGTFTYTPTAGMSTVIFEVQGGGAGGGGSGLPSVGSVSLSAPGTSGSYAKGRFTAATVGASQTVTIGAGGVAGNNGTGGAGGPSSVGTLIIAPGGVGGGQLFNQSAPSSNANGAFASAPTGGNILSIRGTASSPTLALSATNAVTGTGGASVFGLGAFAVSMNSSGTSAVNPGTGGGGSACNNGGGGNFPGGAGAPGIVIAWEYS